MGEINDYIKDLINLENNLSKIIEKIILDNKGLLLSKLKLRLYNSGIDGSGNKITPEYSESTIAIKKKKGQRRSHVTLRDTGNFYSSMFIEYYKDEVNIYSSDGKEDLLKAKYGEDILGLTSLEQEYFITEVLDPEIQKYIDNINNQEIDLF